MTNEEKDLLEKYENSRNNIESYINELELLKETILKMFPDKLDARNRMFLEDKVKTSTGFYDSLLKMRQEIHKCIDKEIDIRRKIRQEENGKNNDDFDIPSIFQKLMDSQHKVKQAKQEEK